MLFVPAVSASGIKFTFGPWAKNGIRIGIQNCNKNQEHVIVVFVLVIVAVLLVVSVKLQ